MTRVPTLVLHDVVVQRGARVRRAVLDVGTEVAEGAEVGGDDGLVLVASGERVSGRLGPGARQPAR